jgi:hypothetical protein
LIALAVVGVIGVPAAQAANAPTITTFTAAACPNNWWLFSGTVTDPNPVSCVIHFGGLPSLMGEVAQCDASGHFSLMIQLQPGEGGTATATAVDGKGFHSITAMTNVIAD